MRASYQSESALTPKDMKPEGMPQMIMDDCAKVAVCARYLPNSDYQKSNLCEGISIAQPLAMCVIPIPESSTSEQDAEIV
nr:hypothetical protein [uncultured Halomonas sp.]